MSLLERFTTYVRFNTQSDENNMITPSTNGQTVFGKFLVEELRSIGMMEVTQDENGYVMATLPSNCDHSIPTIGFIAHLDTSPDLSGVNVNPQIVKDYDGEIIVLSDDYCLDPIDFPELKKYIGQDLITTDGSTLLGADDKAGIAEIVTAMEYLLAHPAIPHGKIRIAFTPDEEIGLGAHKFDVERFGADWAYTMDGGELGELEYENFNAASATLTIRGRNIHPGYAKHKMRNALRIAHEFIAMLPASESPEYTSGYEGFYHLIKVEGGVDAASVGLIIRDHDRAKFEKRKQLISQTVELLNSRYADAIELTLKDQYYNMREIVEPQIHIVDLARRSMEELSIVPIIKPIRGGTDGSQLSFKGLPCPNLFAGGHNFHGRYEYVSLQSMEKSVKLIVQIAKNSAKQ